MGDVFFTRKYIKEELTNFFGTGVDGNFSTGGNTNLNVLNTGSYTGDMVVRQYESLTINSGHTLTTNQPCRGLLIYVQGNCTINGTLSMTARGASANPTTNGASDTNPVDPNGLRFPFFTQSGNQTLNSSESLLNGCGTLARQIIANHPSINNNGTVLRIQRIGANGGARTGGGEPINPNNGANGSTGQTGGGGSGGGYYTFSQAGGGGKGTCFSGGTGGGGSHGGTNSVNGSDFGGSGGRASTSDGGYPVPGGIGNPNGRWSNTTATYIVNGVNNSNGGTGGLIVLIVGGTLTIGSGGAIRSNGVSGPNFSNQNRGGGGSSGGGTIAIAHRSINNSGSITATGGPRWGWASSQRGGAGGNGSIQILQVL